MSKYAVITPVYNRPEEVDELLESLTRQTFTDFEVIIVEDGSTKTCRHICEKYKDKLSVRYFFKENTGQGFSRNYAASHANSPFLVFFDSDVLLPEGYFETVNAHLAENDLDAFGGEDRASPNFSALQKAISYAMTSFFSTGGIRNKNSNVGGKYDLRSYNMGIKRVLFDKIGGFKRPNMGEDMELNNRLNKLDVRKALIPNAYVFHKRRGSFASFYRQVLSFGQTRIQLYRHSAIKIKPVHFLPPLFALVFVTFVLSFFIFKPLYYILFLLFSSYFCIIFIDSLRVNKSIWVAVLSVPACFIQLFAYGVGFFYEALKRKKMPQAELN